MRKLVRRVLPVLLLLLPAAVSADPVAPYIEGFRVALVVDDGPVNLLEFGGAAQPWYGADTFSGLGTIQVEVTGAGEHHVSLFWDLDIFADEDDFEFFNDAGSTSGAAPAGLSWQIDVPFYDGTDIFESFSTHALGNSAFDAWPDDLATALSWNFVLHPGQTAFIDFVATTDIPSSGFYLLQEDESGAAVAFYSTIRVVPEPGTLLLVGTGVLFGLGGFRRRTT